WGFVCIGPNYTHTNSGSTPDDEGYSPENSRRARRAIEVLAATPGGDTNRLALFGHSMGGFLTAGLAGEITTQVRAGCLVASGTSGTSLTNIASPAVQEVVGTTAPFLMFHETLDPTVTNTQSSNFAAILTSNGVPNKRLLYQGTNHNMADSTVKRADIYAVMRAWFTQYGVLVSATNTAPTISAATNVTVTNGVASAPFPVTVGDAETAPGSLQVSWFSTDDVRLTNSAIALGGSGANRTLTFTPPAGQTGAVPVSLVVHDGQLSAATYFTVNIVSNSGAPPATSNIFRPLISWIADQRTASNTAIGPLAFTISDADTAVSNLVLSTESSNPTLLPTNNISLGGLLSNRTVTVTPSAGQSNGVATVTLTVSDGEKSSATSFTLTVTNSTPSNSAPLIQGVPNAVIAVNTSYGTNALVIKDDERTESALTLSRMSSNPTLLPTNNIVLGGQNWGRNFLATPVAGQTGRATVTFTVSDGTNTASTSFVLDVVASNTPPALVAPSNQIVALGAAPLPAVFTIGDAESAASNLLVTATSSNTNLVRNTNIVFGGSGSNRTVTLTPQAGVTGAATISLALTDGDFTTRQIFLFFVLNSNAPAAQFNRPRGVFILDGAGPTNYTTTFGLGIPLRDSNIRNLPYVDGFTLRVGWESVEGGLGQYDFFIISNALNKLPAGQKLSVILTPDEPAYIAATPGVATWNDGGTLRAVPWDPFLRTRRRAMLQAMAAYQAGGVALAQHPRLVMLDPFLPGGHTGIRDPNNLALRNMTNYARTNLLAAVQDELRSLQTNFPGKLVQIGFWPVTDNENASYGGTNAWTWIRAQLLAEFNGLTRPRAGFFMENLAAERIGPRIDPFTATPITSFAAPMNTSRSNTWNGFQMLGDWTRPFNDGHVDNTLNGTPNDAIEYAYNTYGAEYHEIYISDVESLAFRQTLTRWHEFFASGVTTNPNSDEDGDGLPLWWENLYGLSPVLATGTNGARGDPDGDTVLNLAEFALNQNPLVAGIAGLPTAFLTTNAGKTYLTFTYRRRTDAPWLTYEVEVSSDLALWLSGVGQTESAGAPVPSGDGVTEFVTVRALPAIEDGGPKLAARLRIRTGP
ncbi:MAG TPA: dienelactone hydrolase family protein, partial [Verrucomicrobiae bacterium]